MAYMYILRCSDGTFYTGSTRNMERRLAQHQSGSGANYTSKRLPVVLVYVEQFDRISDAYYRERQIHCWSHQKKKALIEGKIKDLRKKAECRNQTHHRNKTRK